MGRSESSTRRVALLAGAALLFTALLGVVHLPFPFHGDQALFELTARSLDRGAVLYVDIWDNKQPGIIWFFEAAGKLFGFGETGVHALDLAWQLALGGLLAFGLRREFGRGALAALLPLATAGAYWCAAGERQMTQVEALIGLPLVAAMILARPGAGPRSFFLSGVCAGTVAVFKHILAPIAAVFWVVSALQARRGEGGTTGRPGDPLARSFRTRLLPAAAGVLLVLGLVAGRFAMQGALGPLAWNAFVYPVRAVLASPAAPASRFFDSSFWFISRFAPWLALALLGAWRGRRDWVRSYSLAWLVTGGAALLVQRFSLWDYHFLLFVVPVGLLAVRAIETLTARPAVRAAVGVAACLPGLYLWAPKAVAWAAIAPGRDPAAVSAYQRRVSPHYEEFWAETAFLREPGAVPGPIYAWGDPRILLLSGREQAIPLHGWAWEDMLDEQVTAAAGQLMSRPPPYLYLGRLGSRLLERRLPALLAWTKSDYTLQAAGAHGDWLRHADAPIPPAR